MQNNNARLLAQVRQSNRIRRRDAVAVVPIRKNPTVKSVNRKVKRIQRREELKHKDTIHSAVEMVADPGVTQMVLLNGLVNGTTNVTRIGDRISITSVQTRGTINLPVGNLTACMWRVIIFRDLQTNGAAPVYTDILDTSVITTTVHAPYNQDNSDRFRIISDKTGVLNSNRNQVTNLAGADTTTTSVGSLGVKYKLKWSLNFPTIYGLGNAGTVADISKNSIYILFLSDRSDASNVGATFTGGTRVYYKDD